MGFHFATQLYDPLDRKTYARLVDVLEKNLELTGLEAATVFLDQCSAPWHDSRVRWIPRHGRSSYSDFLRLVDTSNSSTLQNDMGSHVLFANSDILFDETVHLLAERLSRPDWAACITRHELDGTLPAGIEPFQSQDAWMLRRQQLHPRLIDQLEGVHLGIAGCEQLLAAALVAYGFDLWNPCEDCRILHTDPAPVRHHSGGDRYWGLYAYVPICSLKDIGTQEPHVYFSYAMPPGRYYSVKLE